MTCVVTVHARETVGIDKLSGKKAIVAFTQAEGADSHCEPAASGIRGERIFDWLDEQIPA